MDFCVHYACNTPKTALAVVTVLLMGCGGSDNNQASDTGGLSTDQPTDVLETNPAATPLIMPLNTRNLAIDVLELMDALNFASIVIPDSVLTLPSGDQECAGGGSFTASSVGAGTEFNFSNCILSTAVASALTGELTMSTLSGDISSASYEIDFRYGNGFSINNGQRSVVAEGGFFVTSVEDDISVKSESVKINDGQGDFTATTLLYTKTAASDGTSAFNFVSNVDTTRFGFVVAVSTTADLIASRVSCPTAGTLTITATDSSTLTIRGADGDNVLVSSENDLETVNCSEISTLESGGSQTAVIVPPSPPGAD